MAWAQRQGRTKFPGAPNLNCYPRSCAPLDRRFYYRQSSAQRSIEWWQSATGLLRWPMSLRHSTGIGYCRCAAASIQKQSPGERPTSVSAIIDQIHRIGLRDVSKVAGLPPVQRIVDEDIGYYPNLAYPQANRKNVNDIGDIVTGTGCRRRSPPVAERTTQADADDASNGTDSQIPPMFDHNRK